MNPTVVGVAFVVIAVQIPFSVKDVGGRMRFVIVASTFASDDHHCCGVK